MTTHAPIEHPVSVDIRDVAEVVPIDPQSKYDFQSMGPLYDVLFGALGLPNDLESYQFDHPGTFAILDAARVMHLSGLLQGSGLRHACLFVGQAFEDLGDAGPWLVQLDPDSKFTRDLFTSSDMPWHLWRLEPGVFFRARTDFDRLREHFRKFTKITDEDGKHYYFRFWEPEWTANLLTSFDANQSSSFLSPLEAVIVFRADGATQVISGKQPHPVN